MNVVEIINYTHLQKDSPGCLSSSSLAGQNPIETSIDTESIPSTSV
jgi:hypothetical protein